MIVNVPLNAIGEDLASLPGLNIPSLVYCVREGAEIKFCAFCTRQIVVSPTSPPFSASLSRAPAIRPSLSLAPPLPLPLPVLTAMKRGRDNARVEEISPRFYPRHRFEGSTVVSPNLPRSRILVISDGRDEFFFPLPFFLSFFLPQRIFFHQVDAWIKISSNENRCEYTLDKFAELHLGGHL